MRHRIWSIFKRFLLYINSYSESVLSVLWENMRKITETMKIDHPSNLARL